MEIASLKRAFPNGNLGTREECVSCPSAAGDSGGYLRADPRSYEHGYAEEGSNGIALTIAFPNGVWERGSGIRSPMGKRLRLQSGPDGAGPPQQTCLVIVCEGGCFREELNLN